MTWTDLTSNYVTGSQYTAAAANAVAAAINAIVDGATTAAVATQETTTSTVYADLATTTDQVTVTIGSSGKALVFINVSMYMSTTSAQQWVGVALSGANTVAAVDTRALFAQPGSGEMQGAGSPFLITSLSAGSTTFKLKYRVSSGTGTFFNRSLIVIPFP